MYIININWETYWKYIHISLFIDTHALCVCDYAEGENYVRGRNVEYSRGPIVRRSEVIDLSDVYDVHFWRPLESCRCAMEVISVIQNLGATVRFIPLLRLQIHTLRLCLVMEEAA